MGIGQASGVVAGLCAVRGENPREINVKLVQDKLVELGASVWRNPDKKALEEELATKCVKEYIKKQNEIYYKARIIGAIHEIKFFGCRRKEYLTVIGKLW